MTEEDRAEIERLTDVIRNWIAVTKWWSKNRNKTKEDWQKYDEAQQEAVKARATLKNKYNHRPLLDDDEI
jgi:hypothetical protein